VCEFLSFFVNQRADKLPLGKRYLFGDLRSHSGTMEAHVQAYGKPDVWREAEWTGDDAKSLVVRTPDSGFTKELFAIVLGDFPTRDLLIAHALTQLPDGLKTLYLRGCTSLAALPELASVKSLDLRGCTSLAALPELASAEYLDLSGGTSLAALPEVHRYGRINGAPKPASV